MTATFYDDGKDYDWARDEMYDPEPDWSERDERTLQEIWEMDIERMSEND